MNVSCIARWCIVAALLALSAPLGLNHANAFQRAPAGAVEGVEILTRGPVHEAFAATVIFDPEPGLVASKAPPAAIEEAPPEQRPEGANVAWIPGYWAWDDERTDFLWVSGTWRALPPGRQWVPGYWGSSRQGAQWTSGYWADARAEEVEYLPEPPATVEAGPNVTAPSADHAWLPGSWLWQQNRYAWRPGYWAVGQSDWDWVPAHYVWSPRGYVYVDGYYDYSVARRGVLFAPVYFNSGIYTQRGFSYSPVSVINPAVFASHLFLRPSYGHYYFGDYYGSSYASSGFSPWFSFHSSRSGYDPFYARQRWNHRNDRQWDRGVEADFARMRDNEEARPPRTWTTQRDRSKRDPTNNDKSLVVAASLDELAKSRETPLRLQPLAKEDRQQIAQRGQEVRIARDERQKLEAAATDQPADATIRDIKPVKVKLPKTPIVAQPVDRFIKGEAPPKVIDAPGPDSKIEPKPRIARGNAKSPPDPKAKVESKAKPKSPPDPKAKVESKQKPKVEPTEAPKGGPDGQPKAGSKKGPPKGKDKGKDKEKDKDDKPQN